MQSSTRLYYLKKERSNSPELSSPNTKLREAPKAVSLANASKAVAYFRSRDTSRVLAKSRSVVGAPKETQKQPEPAFSIESKIEHHRLAILRIENRTYLPPNNIIYQIGMYRLYHTGIIMSRGDTHFTLKNSTKKTPHIPIEIGA